MIPRLRRLGLLLGVATAVILAGCGAPPAGTTSRLDPNSVPYGLLDKPKPTQQTVTAPTSLPQRIWFVRSGRLAALTPTGTLSGGQTQQANALLVELLNGPNEAQHNEGYESALSTGVTVTVREVESGTARLQIRERRDAGRPAADGPLAVGQIVLTVTSVPGIDSVLLDDGTRALQAPLPGGALASRAVNAQDYTPLITVPDSAPS